MKEINKEFLELLGSYPYTILGESYHNEDKVPGLQTQLIDKFADKGGKRIYVETAEEYVFQSFMADEALAHPIARKMFFNAALKGTEYPEASYKARAEAWDKMFEVSLKNRGMLVYFSDTTTMEGFFQDKPKYLEEAFKEYLIKAKGIDSIKDDKLKNELLDLDKELRELRALDDYDIAKFIKDKSEQNGTIQKSLIIYGAVPHAKDLAQLLGEDITLKIALVPSRGKTPKILTSQTPYTDEQRGDFDYVYYIEETELDKVSNKKANFSEKSFKNHISPLEGRINTRSKWEMNLS